MPGRRAPTCRTRTVKLVALQTQKQRSRLASGVACAGFWGTGVLMIEAVGRYVTSDVGDVLGVSLVGVVLLSTWMWHRRSPLAPVRGLGRGLHSLAQRFWDALPEFAVDFRQEPPLPNAVPRLFTRTTAALLLALPPLFAAAGLLPGGLRDALAPLSYSLYAACLFGLWGVLCTSIVSMLFYYALGALHENFPSALQGAVRRGRREWWLLGAFVLGMGLGAWLLPAWAPLAILTLLFLVCAVALHLPGNASFTLLWRNERNPEPRSLYSHQAALVQLTPFLLFVVDVGLLARGELLFARDLDAGRSMPLTNWLGLVFVWSAVGAFGIATWQVLRQVHRSRAMGRAGLAPPKLWFEGETEPALRAILSAEADELGWSTSFAPEERPSCAVRARATHERQELDPWEELFGSPPLSLSAGELARPEVRERVERKAQAQWRRQLGKGLRRLFKAAGRRRFENGHGFWLGLQHWFLVGMSRDTDQDELEQRPVAEQIVGAPYHELFPADARRYFRELCADLGVDLIFVEDGLGYRRFEQALRVLYEVHDIHGGQMRLEERHFVGCAGVRAVVHELSNESPFRSETYPEPDYQDIARARILHLFRDRGGDRAQDDIPSDLTDLPLPLALA